MEIGTSVYSVKSIVPVYNAQVSLKTDHNCKQVVTNLVCLRGYSNKMYACFELWIGVTDFNFSCSVLFLLHNEFFNEARYSKIFFWASEPCTFEWLWVLALRWWYPAVDLQMEVVRLQNLPVFNSESVLSLICKRWNYTSNFSFPNEEI